MSRLFLIFVLFTVGYGKQCALQNEELDKFRIGRESTCNGTDRYRIPGSCLCKEGFHRDENGLCVEWGDCCGAKQCQAHETYHICGKPCDKTCTEQNPESCNTHCGPAACVCEDNFYRDLTGACVPIEQCRQCPDNEEFKSYGTHCEHSCGSQVSSWSWCKDRNDPNCACKEGYVRDAKAGNRCVPAAYCSEPMCTGNQIYGFVECENACSKSTSCDYGWRCHCKPGHLRDENNNCVPKGSCKVTNIAKLFYDYNHWYAHW